MIIFWMVLLLSIPIAAGIEALTTDKTRVLGRGVLFGICMGGLIWNAYIYYAGFPWLSILFVILAIALLLWVVLKNTRALLYSLVALALYAGFLFGAWQGLLLSIVNRETVSRLEVLNPDAERGTVLMVYHPGGSEFQQRMNESFAEGLTENGWRVEITTASREAPSDLFPYDLLVLGTPTYDWGEPSRPIKNYLERLGNLNGMSVVTITSGMGYIARPELDDLVKQANGKIVESIQIYTTAPNQQNYDSNDHEQIMLEQARSLPL